MDVVYPVRPGDANEELRYSLRSLQQNYPKVDRIWLVGYQPRWVQGVEFIDGNKGGNSHANVYLNVLAAMRHPDVSDDVVVFNDDFFITEPITEIQTMYRCTLQEHMDLPKLRNAPRSWWKESLNITKVCLQAVGIPEPLSYELHVPMPCKKGLMRETLERFEQVTPMNPPQWRSLYGNLHVSGAEQAPDSKLFRPGKLPAPFLSTSDASWPSFRQRVSALFPEPSRYEVPVPPRRR